MPTRFPLALLVTATLAACDSSPNDPASPTATNDDYTLATTRWTTLTRAIVGRREPGPVGTARSFALVAVAQYDAVIAAESAPVAAARPSVPAAAAAAAARVLTTLYPAEQAVVDSQLAADAAYYPTAASQRGTDYASGVTVGQGVATAVLARAASDGSNAVWTGSIPSGPGYWVNAPAPAQPLAPLWGQVKPWLMTSGSQFRPAAPPAFGSAEFTSALAEVKQTTAALTPAQLQIAQFWQTGSGAGGPMGYFGAQALAFAATHHLDERATARTVAVLYMAMMDASISCWDAKYAFWYVRPFQADASIPTPVGRPNFPSYPSAHSCLSASAAGVLSGLFPETSATLQAEVAEAGVARIYAGLHYRFDITAGKAIGDAVAALALAHVPGEHAAIPLQ